MSSVSYICTGFQFLYQLPLFTQGSLNSHYNPVQQAAMAFMSNERIEVWTGSPTPQHQQMLQLKLESRSLDPQPSPGPSAHTCSVPRTACPWSLSLSLSLSLTHTHTHTHTSLTHSPELSVAHRLVSFRQHLYLVLPFQSENTPGVLYTVNKTELLREWGTSLFCG